MGSIRVERLDHVGVIATVIQDLGLIPMSNARLVPDAQEAITPGDAIAGMMLNGLGFANRPLSLTPQLFASTPLDVLFRAGISAEMFNRFQLGRTLDEAYTYGCDLLFQELALAVCTQAGLDLRGNHLDTTSFSLSGEDVPERDAHAITITQGYSRDHRPDVTQAVLELMVSQAGGVPFLSNSWDGHTSDTQIFQERAQALMRAFQNASSPRYLIADSKLYHDHHAANLAPLGCITRIPHTLGDVSQVIRQALTQETWHLLDDHTRYQRLELCHDGIAQRWLVGHSQAALARAEATVNHTRPREEAALTQPLFHLQAQRFATPEMAQEARTALARSWTSHQVASYHLIAHKRDARKGRPTPHQSGQSREELGIAKAGNRHIRGMAIEIAWGWLRFQPESELSRWYQARFGQGSTRVRKIGIVALARKLLIARWRFLETGALPKGAVRKAEARFR